MSEHAIELHWERAAAAPAADGSYGRDHDWQLEDGSPLRVSAAAEYGGSAALLNPELALVGALASCQMLSFLALAARRGWVVEDYRDRAVGRLERDARGRMAITRVQLRPAVRFAAPGPDPEEQQRLHTGAHRGCFIAHSLLAQIDIAPQPPEP